jgi:Leucine Rich repeat
MSDIGQHKFVISTNLSRPTIDAKLWDARRNPRYTKLCLTGVLGVHGYQQAEPLMVDRNLAMSLCELLRCDDRIWDRIEIEHTDGEIDLIIAVALSTDRIKTIWFSEVELNVATCHALATGLKYNRSVTELGLKRCRVGGPVTVGLIGDGVRGNPAIESISLEQCNLQDGEVADFVACLRQCASLTKLSVEGNVCRDRSIHELDLLLREMTLQSLSLHNQRIEEEEQLDLAPIAQCLHGQNSAVKFLDLSRNGLGDHDVTLLMEGLIDNNQSLTTLHLDQNLISNDGARTIAEALPNLSPSFKTLALPENPLIDELGATLLLDSIRRQMYVETLILPSGISHIQRKIRWYGNMNRGGRRLFSTPRKVAMSLYPLIVERVNNIPPSHSWNPETAAPETIYGFLRFGPILFEQEENEDDES